MQLAIAHRGVFEHNCRRLRSRCSPLLDQFGHTDVWHHLRSIIPLDEEALTLSRLFDFQLCHVNALQISYFTLDEVEEMLAIGKEVGPAVGGV